MRLEKRGVHPVRIWNFVPQINREALSRQPRYHLFNRGRFSAFQSRCDGEPLSLDLCAASAVDIGTNELEVHVLASAHPGIAIENPRQVAAYEYSPRYGANPPCFTRATRLAPLAHRDWEGEIALVSGTASIVGEDSEHLGDVEAQARETLTNLAVVAATAFPGAARASSRLLSGDLARRDLLALYRLVRVYVVRETEIGDVVRLFEELLAADCELELVVADLCRPSLLLEAEGVAVWKQVAMESNRR
ncbi:MAG: hypothetical protein GY725_08435 [bacterium]|nr:hypothetical protein [bacterium]